MIAFIEMEESIQEAPFDRYTDLSGLTQIRIGIDHIIHTARRRRTVKQPVKTALFADNPMSFSVAHSYELLMYGAMIEVRAFNKRTSAAEWLEVPLKTLECPL
jgi:methyl coenzyme M reductase alpha subunit